MKRGVLLCIALALAFALYYFSAGEPEAFALDKTSFRVVLEDLPTSQSAAVEKGGETLLTHYNISAKKFDKYFTLSNVSRTENRWILSYSAAGNQQVLVYLVKKITPEEGFGIADGYIARKVGEEYFKLHYRRTAFEDNVARYIFTINGSGAYNMDMWVRVSDERGIEGKHALLEPQKVKVKAAEAEEISSEKGIPGPVGTTLVFDGTRLVWRVTWKHVPSSEDYAEKRVYGADVDAEMGSVLRVHKYSKPTKSEKVSAAQVDSLVQRIGEFGELQDGSVMNIRISRSQSEKFHAAKSLGRVVVKEGLAGDADITIWIDLDAFEGAIRSSNPVEYLSGEAKNGKVTVETEKNLITLTRKGYKKLYDTLM